MRRGGKGNSQNEWEIWHETPMVPVRFKKPMVSS